MQGVDANRALEATGKEAKAIEMAPEDGPTELAWPFF